MTDNEIKRIQDEVRTCEKRCEVIHQEHLQLLEQKQDIQDRINQSLKNYGHWDAYRIHAADRLTKAIKVQEEAKRKEAETQMAEDLVVAELRYDTARKEEEVAWNKRPLGPEHAKNWERRRQAVDTARDALNALRERAVRARCVPGVKDNKKELAGSTPWSWASLFAVPPGPLMDCSLTRTDTGFIR